MKKQELANYGVELIKKFCEINNIKLPKINIVENWRYGVCGYYRNRTINVCLKKCANNMNNPTAWCWSHVGYFVDREPAGVVCHEFGHYLHDILTDNTFVLPTKGRITSYEPNHCERFAETIKLFVLNPDLLKQYAPARYGAIIALGLKPVIKTDWRTTMGVDVNPKFIAAAEKRIASQK